MLSLQELLDWLEYVATDQGPRLIASDERFTTQTLAAITERLWDFLRLAQGFAVEQRVDSSWSSPLLRLALQGLQQSMTDSLGQLHHLPVR